ARRRAIRNAALVTREALSATSRAALERRLEAHLAVLLESVRPSTLGFCWPFRSEPDLRAFVACWLRADPARRAALPVVTGRGEPLAFRRWTLESEMEPDCHGIPCPREGALLDP